MIKIQDFATEKGVSRQAIYKHFNKHIKELDGHYERRGKNGTWLDDFACDFISDLMLQQPIVVTDTSLQQELERLRNENSELMKALLTAKDSIISLKDEVQLSKTELLETKTLLSIAQNSAERTSDLEKKTEQLQSRANELEQQLQEEKTRKISFSEWWSRK